METRMSDTGNLKAGFRGDAIVQAGEGPAILMTFDGAV
jgi:hypothetical protein